MAGFDPFANQGGPAVWDPDYPDHSRELADKLLREVDGEPPPGDAVTQRDDQREERHVTPAASTTETAHETADDDPFTSPAFTD